MLYLFGTFFQIFIVYTPPAISYKNKVTAWRTKGGIMALSLSASVKVGESPWRLSVDSGCLRKIISLDIQNTHPYD